jgi:hypothetical protein
LRNLCAVGKTYNQLTVMEALERNKHSQRFFLCVCSCGGSVKVVSHALTSGNTKSCGCAKKRAAATTGKHSTTHGMSKTSTYRVWTDMIRRCTDPSREAFKDYGGRGISVCQRWSESFTNFMLDMGAKPIGLTLDRIENNGNYEPGNCRWATPLEQAQNRRTPVNIEEDRVAEAA